MTDKPILYVCPFCVKGRFTSDDGWDAAVAHVRAHSKKAPKKTPPPEKTGSDEEFGL